MSRSRSLFFTLLSVGLTAGTLTTSAQAEVLWSDDFSTDTSGDYTVLEFSPGRDGAIFNYDYSAVGIPDAPNTTDGSTKGVRLFANKPFEDTVGATSAVQFFPTGLDAALEGKDFSVQFDIWMNTNGPMPGGGAGSTEAFMIGVGFTGDFAIEAGNYDGSYFTITGEAGATVDVRTFANESYNGFNADGTPFNVTELDDTVTRPLGTDANPYYHEIFPGGIDVSALDVQGGEDEQIGITNAGQMAFEWHTAKIEVFGTTASFLVDELLIAEVQDADVEGNILVGYADYFASEAGYPEWVFGIVDNLIVSTFGGDGVTGDFDGNGTLDSGDINTLTAAIAAGTSNAAYDLTGDTLIDADDITYWAHDLKKTWIGDANLDGEFNTSDLVTLFAAGTYENGEAAVWTTGDFTGDGV
ncbi:MAG: hypothetical protein KDB23_23950, partial [Planctomycetales bacterium]|nr:hypothetical protein [Planctomycetales bacterium]